MKGSMLRAFVDVMGSKEEEDYVSLMDGAILPPCAQDEEEGVKQEEGEEERERLALAVANANILRRVKYAVEHSCVDRDAQTRWADSDEEESELGEAVYVADGWESEMRILGYEERYGYECGCEDRVWSSRLVAAAEYTE